MCSWLKDHLFIVKKHWSTKLNRPLTIREIIKIGAGKFSESKLFEENDIILVNNTPQEIVDVVMEMDARLQGEWIPSFEDESLQDKFWSLIPKSEYHGKIVARIGAKFLRENQYLLE